MNLNDSNYYYVIMFKRTYYYTPKQNSMMLRDVMLKYTKDGAKPNLGIQEIFLLDLVNYEKLLSNGNKFTRDLVRSLSNHSFSNKGYKRLN